MHDERAAEGAARQPSFGRVLHRVALGFPEPSSSTRALEVDAAPVTHRSEGALAKPSAARSSCMAPFIVHGGDPSHFSFAPSGTVNSNGTHPFDLVVRAGPRSDLFHGDPPRSGPHIVRQSDTSTAATERTANHSICKNVIDISNGSLESEIRSAGLLPIASVTMSSTDTDNHLIKVHIGSNPQCGCPRWCWDVEYQ